MRKLSLIITAFALAGCGGQPLTPQQQAMFMQIMQNNQAAQQQALAHVVQPVPTNQQTNCTTSFIGNTAYTHCQ